VRHSGVYHGAGELEKDAESLLQRWLADIDAKTPEAAIEGTVIAQVRRVVKRYTPRKPVVLAFARWHDGAPKEG
jgi:acyl CoA:acetate/3-ketoacid CoA transferase